MALAFSHWGTDRLIKSKKKSHEKPHFARFDYTNIPSLSVENRPISQEEEGKKNEKGGAERGRRKKGSTLLSLTIKIEGRTDKVSIESWEKISFRSVLIIYYLSRM